MLREMSAQQWHDWKAFYHFEPHGDDRADWHAAQIAAQLLNAADLIRSGKTTLQYQPKDFLLDFKRKAVAVKEAAKPAPMDKVLADSARFKSVARMWVAYANAGNKKKRKR